MSTVAPAHGPSASIRARSVDASMLPAGLIGEERSIELEADAVVG